MAKQIINVGTAANSKNGDSLRTAFQKVNANFAELYAGGLGGGNIDLSAVNQHIIPATNLTYNLGSPTHKWHSLYVGVGSIYIGDAVLSLEAGKLNSSVGFSTDNLTLGGVQISINDQGQIEAAGGTEFVGVGAPGATGPQGPAGADALWNWQGAYNAGPQYQEGDIVSYQGSTYRRNATGNSVVGEPPTNTTYWQIVAQKGADGTGGGSGDRLVNGLNEVVLGSDGGLTFPTGGQIANYPDGVGASNNSWFVTPGGEDGNGGVSSQDGQQYIQINNNLFVEIGTSYGTANQSIWRFGRDGDLTLPAGGDIINSSGQSVLGGGSNSYTPDDTDNWEDPAVNTVQAALDELAARMTAFENFEIDGGNAYTPAAGELLIDGNGA